MSSLNRFCGLLVFLGLVCPILAFGMGPGAPLIPLELEADMKVPFLGSYLLEPVFPEIDPLKGDSRAHQSLYHETRVDFERYKAGDLSLSDVSELQEVLVGLCKYYALQSKRGVNSRYIQSLSMLGDVSYGLSRSDKRHGLAAIHRYLHLIAKYEISKETKGVLKKLLRLREELKRPLVRRVLVLEAFEESMTKSRRQKSIRFLDRMATRRQILNPLGRLVEKMIHIRVYSGLDKNGQFMANPRSGFVLAFSDILDRATKLAPALRGDVLKFGAALWAKSRKLEIGRFPIELKPKKSIVDAALKERFLLAKGGQDQPLVSLYFDVMKRNSEAPFALRLVKLVLDQRKERFIDAQDIGKYYEFQLALRNVWPNNELKLGKYGRRVTRFLDEQRHTFIKNQLKLIKSREYDSKMNLELAKISRKELQYNRNGVNEEIVNGLTQALARSGQIEKAEKLFRKTVGEADNIKSLKTLASIHRRAAKWPNRPPWERLPKKGKGEARKKLLVTYNKLAKAYQQRGKQTPWTVLSHLSLLYFSFDKDEKAIEIWKKQLKDSGNRSIELKSVLASLVKLLHSRNNHAQLYKVVGYLRKVGVQPIVDGDPKRLRQLWLDSVYALTSEARPRSRQLHFLKEFIATSKGDNRDPMVYMTLARKYEEKNEIGKALKVMEMFLSSERKATERAKFLLAAHQMAVEGGVAAEAVAFGLTFTEENNHSQQVPRIRENILKVFIKKGVKKKLLELGREQFNDQRASGRQRLSAAAMVLRVSGDYLAEGSAKPLVKHILKNGSENHRALATAYGYWSRKAFKKADLNELRSIYKRLTLLNSQNPAIAEVEGQVAFFIGEKSVSQATKIESLPNSEQLDEIMKQHDRILSLYDRACRKSPSSYCAAAKYRSALFAEGLVGRLERMSQRGNIPAEKISRVKQDVLKDMLKSSESARRLAIKKKVKKEWRTQIMNGAARIMNGAAPISKKSR